MSKILIVEDDDTLRHALSETIELENFHVDAVSTGKDAIELIKNTHIDLVISDIRMDHMNGHQLYDKIKKTSPGLPVLLMTAHGTIKDAVEAMRCGVVDYLLKPFEPEILINKIKQHINQNDYEEGKPIAVDEKSLKLINLAKKVAQTDATILISGESGTGKEVLSRFIHNHSQRNEKPFVAINCAAIPEQMLEATLFGYEKGAFTGAVKSNAGKFEQANGGTLLLDEISEMALNLQVKLLRVLQEKEVERIGGQKIIPLDVRVIATTNRHMREEIEAKRFREDLYYRLNVFPLHILPLRERREDIVPLAESLIQRHHLSSTAMPQLSEEAKTVLCEYSWPGNTREMDNVIQRALILQQGALIEDQDLHLNIE